MKKIAIALLTMLFVCASVFAQSDLQVLAVVKYNKNESITVKQLKKECSIYEKGSGGSLSVEDKKAVLETMIASKLIQQAAGKAGFAITDSDKDKIYENYLSGLLGVAVTEKQFNDLVRENYNMSADDFILQQTGFTKSEIKDRLSANFLVQQYIVTTKQAEIAKIAPTDDQIRKAYDANKSGFIWNDMAKILIVGVPKENDANAAKIKANELRNKLADKKLSAEQLKVQSTTGNAGYLVNEGFLEKTSLGAQMLGITMEDLLDLFSQKTGYVSDLIESELGYTFISVLKKYDAKMLGISDIIQPESTITVYDYIRNVLTNQLQLSYVQQYTNELAQSLNTPANVERKKTGAALDKLLDWGD